MSFLFTPARVFLTETVVVVPCYNEAARIEPNRFLDFLSARPGLTFLFVNDGSTDRTQAVLDQMQSACPDQVRVLSLAKNVGKAEAVRVGMYRAIAMAPFVGYWDADLATPLDAIDDLMKVARKYEDISVVFGSRRALLGHRIKRAPMRRVVSRTCAIMARQAVRLPLGDTQCGAKIFRSNAALAEAIDRPFSTDWLFDVELFSRLARLLPNKQDAFFEYPLPEWNEVAGSNVSAAAILASGVKMLRLIFTSRLPRPQAWPRPVGKVQVS